MVFALKVNKKEANEMIKKLRKENLIDENYKIKKDNEFVYIPLKKEIKGSFEVSEEFFNKKNKKNRELLVKSFDVIGDIAITVIPEELKEKKYEIGKSIAETAKVKTVLAEKGPREGEFRLQKFELIYGKDKRETIYKENNCRFLVNVDKVYFSPRLSTDRLEIAKKIEEGENVLVMFSGVQPYPIVIAKNSKANLIVGIEKNPEAFYYSFENLKLNKLDNVFVFINDVREVLPFSLNFHRKDNCKKENNYYISKNYISPFCLDKKLGIKTAVDKEQFINKLEKIKEKAKNLNYLVVEIYTKDWDELNNKDFFNFIKEKVNFAKPIIVVHQPYKEGLKEFLKKNELDFDYFVVHPYVNSYYNFEEIEELINFIKDLTPKNRNKILVENLHFKPVNKKEDIKRLIENKIGICFDFSHYMAVLLSEYNKKDAINKFVQDFKELIIFAKKNNTPFYCHISNFPPEANKIDEGFIPIDKVLPFVEFGVFEVVSKNEKEGNEMAYSFNYSFSNLKFDRIVMPLPKGSENFLDLALENIKENGIIHWYQFCKEEEFEEKIKLAKEIANKKGKKLELLNIKKVGSIAPRTYRVRFDFRIK